MNKAAQKRLQRLAARAVELREGLLALAGEEKFSNLDAFTEILATADLADKASKALFAQLPEQAAKHFQQVTGVEV